MKKEEIAKFLDKAGNIDARKVRRSIGSRKASRQGTKRAMWMGGKPMMRRKLLASQRRSAIAMAMR